MNFRLTTAVLLLAAGVLGAVIPGAAPALAQANATATAPTVAPNAPGMIRGRIFDAESGETMPYTNVYISGTNFGTMAFTDGLYMIRGLPAGTYTVKASYISYALGAETVTLHPGETVTLDFRLQIQAILAETYEVAAERQIIEIDRTGTSHYLTAQELQAMPVAQMVDMIAMQPGVTMQDNEIHIRGGRAEDTQFVVDGMSVNDPLGGGGYGYQMDPSIINEIEVLTGGFNAEYGQAVSGVVNVSTKEGNDRVEARVSLKRDYLLKPVSKTDDADWREWTKFGEPKNTDIIKASISGPDPLSAGLDKLGVHLPGTQYLLASGSLETSDGHLPIFSRRNRLESPVYPGSFWTPREENNWNGMLKWTWNIDNDRKFNVNLSRNVAISQGFDLPGEGYPLTFIARLDSALTFTNENIISQAYYRQVLNNKSWFDVTLGRTFTRQHANVNGNDDYSTYVPFTSSSDGTSYGSADRWHDHYSESYMLKGAYSFMGGGYNEFKTGTEISATEIQLVDLASNLRKPPSGKLGIREDIYVAHPITGVAYFQDKFEYRGLIVNGGLRTDFWAPGREVEEVMAHPEGYLFITDEMAAEFDANTVRAFGRSWKARLSPRLGLSFKVTERDKFFFNYGHFSQWPRFLYVYPQLTANVATRVQLLGNPNLDPKITVEYEAGVQHEFGGLWSTGVTFFNRDIFGYAKSVTMKEVKIPAEETPDPNDWGTETISPVRYFNGDSARSLGAELSITKRTTRFLSGSGSLELQRTTGTSSDADAAYLVAAFGQSYDNTANLSSLTRAPLLWDKPWSVSANADFSVFDKDRPTLFGWRMPPNWSLNLLWTAEAGQRYTPMTWVGPRVYLTGAYSSRTGPAKSSLNFRFNKFWKVRHNEKVNLSIEVRNLLNHKNFRRINPWTGDGYKIGDFNPYWTDQTPRTDQDGNEIPWVTDSNLYAEQVVDPSYIEDPLTVQWGLSYSW